MFFQDSPNPLVLGVLQYGQANPLPRALPTTQQDVVGISQIAGFPDIDAPNYYELQPATPVPPPQPTNVIPLRIDFFADPCAPGHCPPRSGGPALLLRAACRDALPSNGAAAGCH